MSRFLGSVSVLFLISIATGCREEVPEPRPRKTPNLIWIMADDLGYGEVGVYGQNRIQTPRLDRMAAEGMKFTHFYAGSTVCAPSRSVLMEGKQVGRAEIRGNREIHPMGQQPLSEGAFTVAGLLREAGYVTGLIGKWGLGGPGSTGEPRRQGFDYFFGYLCQRHAHNYYPEFLFRNEERVALEGNVVVDPRPNPLEDWAGVAVERVTYAPDLLHEEALEFIRRHRAGPFFLYYSHLSPHANNEKTRHDGDGTEVPNHGLYAGKDWTSQNKGHAAMITYLDTQVGEVLDLLRELGIAGNTLVVFTSDNGPHRESGQDPEFFASGGPLRGIKRDLYEGGIRVPTIAWWPGSVPACTESDHVGYFGDLMATAAELARLDPPENTNSISFLPALLGDSNDQERHEYLYWEFYERGSAQAVRQGPWKAIRSPMFEGEVELFHLLADVGEKENLAAEHPEIVEQLVAAMDEAHQPSDTWVVR